MGSQKLSADISGSVADIGESIGIILGPTSANNVSAETRHPVPIGQYVTFQMGSGLNVLGVVESSQVSSRALQIERVTNIYEAEESVTVSSENIRDKSYKVRIKILGLMEELQKCKTVLPEYAPVPGTRIYSAASKELKPLFAPDKPNWLKIGTLLRQQDVEVKVNITKIPSRHLAVLAMTGMGKSNLVSLLAKGVSEIPGSIVIFDYHGEYGTLKLDNINYVKATINPRLLTIDQFSDLLEVREGADLQRTILSKSFSGEIKSKIGDDFWAALSDEIDKVGDDKKQYKNAAIRLNDKIKEAQRRLGDIFQASASDPVDSLKALKTNVINLVELSDKAANVAVAFYLESILNDRKEAKTKLSGTKKSKTRSNTAKRNVFASPVVCILEEAHVFLPKDERTESKYIASKIAREGRKYGVGLVVVSQRPRAIDSNVLSQIGSLAVMKMIQPDDQKQVTAATEAIGSDLINQLPSLNPGEALLIGQWVNLTTFAKVDEVKDREVGIDPDAYIEWLNHKQLSEKVRESSTEYIPDGYIKE